MMELNTKPETGLDPANWNDIKSLGYQIIDDMVDYLKNVGERRSLLLSFYCHKELAIKLII